MANLKITAGSYTFKGRFEDKLAPKTCAKFRSLLPYQERIIHVRWSGEACWIPLGELDLGLDYENHTSFPAPGQIIVYPGGISECEIFFPYGACTTASKVGPLAANHFASIVPDDGWQDRLREMGRRTLWDGAQAIGIEEVG